MQHPVSSSLTSCSATSLRIDSSFLMLARRDGSDGTGQVEAEDLVQEVVAFFQGVHQVEIHIACFWSRTVLTEA